MADRFDRFAAAYLTLSRMFAAPPDQEFLDALAVPGQLAEWPMDRDHETQRGIALLDAYFAHPVPLEQLELDYQWLFVGPGMPRAVAYESVYRSTEQLHFEPATFEVRASYSQFGLEAPRLNQEPDDHVALEFSFLARLCHRGLQAIDAGDVFTADRFLAAEQSFLQEHVLQWVPTMLDRMASGAETDFYRGVAALTAGVLAQAPITAS